jgi:hypothetical protein
MCSSLDKIKISPHFMKLNIEQKYEMIQQHKLLCTSLLRFQIGKCSSKDEQTFYPLRRLNLALEDENHNYRGDATASRRGCERESPVTVPTCELQIAAEYSGAVLQSAMCALSSPVCCTRRTPGRTGDEQTND